MRTIFYLLAALLSNVALTSVTNPFPAPEIEEAMKALLTEVRQNQMWPSRPHQVKRRRYSTSNKNIITSSMIQRTDLLSSSIVSSGVFQYVNSILAAAVPERELAEASRDLETFAQTPLHERPWFEGLPADVKEFLFTVAQANQRLQESWQVEAMTKMEAESFAREYEMREKRYR